MYFGAKVYTVWAHEPLNPKPYRNLKGTLEGTLKGILEGTQHNRLFGRNSPKLCPFGPTRHDSSRLSLRATSYL